VFDRTIKISWSALCSTLLHLVSLLGGKQTADGVQGDC
jgi:hypothetical protein